MEHKANVRGRRREALGKTAYKRTHGIMDRGGKLNPQRMYREQRRTNRELMKGFYIAETQGNTRRKRGKTRASVFENIQRPIPHFVRTNAW